MKQKIADFINIIFGFRKFIMMVVLYVVGIVFRLENLLSGAEMVDLFKATTIAFFGANGVEHIMTTVQGYYNSKTAPAASQDDDIVPESDVDQPKVQTTAGK